MEERASRGHLHNRGEKLGYLKIAQVALPLLIHHFPFDHSLFFFPAITFPPLMYDKWFTSKVKAHSHLFPTRSYHCSYYQKRKNIRTYDQL
ncbi:hypothetical protein POVWA2_031190 [Plasmodium ovale wallikeri]|uniref:Uncharacterized protein n=1 Tax=Plasmodium ovale wallikeri TaxID=864142 RepID=A0A1A8YXI3_PLAOA|nr:hypothetical protein POVWA1_031470 [Plasmodium ovale wallikeri]SBT36640.1 hypothetical protein POVWA2_031190 [Plasmodium ovale wallikeri]